jgi:hypothetical protein
VIVNSGAQTIEFADGSAGAPSITNSGDTNTGMFFPAADTIAFAEGGTEAMRLNSSGNVGIGQTTNPGYRLLVKQSGNTSLAAIGIASVNSANDTYIGMGYSATSDTCFIQATYDTTGAFKPLSFSTSDTERMRIDSSGNVLVGTTSSDPIGANVTGTAILSTGVTNCMASAQPSLKIGRKTSTGNLVDLFYFGGSIALVGNIATNGTGVTYNTSSDYRLKENIVPMTKALDKVTQLKPVTYKWKIDGSNGQGFIAHELQEIVPDCVTGEKDAIDEEGNPVYQGIDTSFLVATLTAAIQEQQTIINDIKAELDNVKTELATLKGAPQ